jgi:nicotinic acid mononucleotide adenylyltransferase
VLRRPGDRVDLTALEAVLPGISSKVVFIDEPPMRHSGRAIRQRVAASQPLEGLVPARVARLIAQRGLYRQPVGS